MLLNKNAFLRGSVSELLAMDALQPTIEKYNRINQDYLTSVEDETAATAADLQNCQSNNTHF